MTKFEVEIYGYGGEIMFGTLTKEQYDYWLPFIDNNDTAGLDSHLFWDPYEEGEGNPITDEDDPRFLGYWHDLDDIAHSCGADVDNCTIVVTNADTGDEVYKSEDLNIEDTEHYLDADMTRGYYFKGYSYEKGQFILAEFETDEFDPKKLTVKVSNINGNHIIDEVEYNNEYLDNEGGGTDGKGTDYEFVEIP